jgi:hypothetical protein
MDPGGDATGTTDIWTSSYCGYRRLLCAATVLPALSCLGNPKGQLLRKLRFPDGQTMVVAVSVRRVAVPDRASSRKRKLTDTRP